MNLWGQEATSPLLYECVGVTVQQLASCPIIEVLLGHEMMKLFMLAVLLSTIISITTCTGISYGEDCLHFLCQRSHCLCLITSNSYH